jgi:hypothetical protein
MAAISSWDLKEVCDERGLRLHVATADVVNVTDASEPRMSGLIFCGKQRPWCMDRDGMA